MSEKRCAPCDGEESTDPQTEPPRCRIAAASIARFDYREQYQAIQDEIMAAIRGVFDSGRLILGNSVRSFEKQICRYLGTVGHGIGVGNGTDAIAIALRALNVGPGDEVLTVANTAVATVAAVRMVGATPVFCDVDPHTLMMDPDDARRRITPKTRAILPVHLFGNAVDMPAIRRLARQHELRIVEDCAQSLGTLLHGQATGTWGDIGCFSFYPTKNLGAYGDGGLCFTRDPRLAEMMRQIRFYGSGSHPSAEREGVNSRLDEIQAAILAVKLKYLPRYVRRRRAVAAEYLKHLSPRIVVPRTTGGAAHSYNLFVIQAARRCDVGRRLSQEGIEWGCHYPVPVHHMKAYRCLGYDRGSLPVTEAAAERILSLPCYPELPLEAIQRICFVLNEVLEQ